MGRRGLHYSCHVLSHHIILFPLLKILQIYNNRHEYLVLVSDFFFFFVQYLYHAYFLLFDGDTSMIVTAVYDNNDNVVVDRIISFKFVFD